MYYLQVIQYEYYLMLLENNWVYVQLILLICGIIFDCNGVIIVDNWLSFSLIIICECIEDLQKIFDMLVEIFGLIEDDWVIFEKCMKQGWCLFELVFIMFEFNEEQIVCIVVNQFCLLGVDVVIQFVCYYLLKEYFVYLVGYVGWINEQELKNFDLINYSGIYYIGKIGIECFYESELYGMVGYEEVEINVCGWVLWVFKCIDLIFGKDIVLSIDSCLQEVVENVLVGWWGVIVVIQLFIGDVLVMVSQLSYDFNLFVIGISFKVYVELCDFIDWLLYNCVLCGFYLLGLMVKLVVVLVGFDVGVVMLILWVFDFGYYQLFNYDYKYCNWNCYGDGWVSLELVIYWFNDIYFYDFVYKLGIDCLYVFMSCFGFGQKVVLDMFGEVDGLMFLCEWKCKICCQVWYLGEILIFGIGQGYMQVMLIQLVQMIVLLVNKGYWICLYLVKIIDGQLLVDFDLMFDIVLCDLVNWDCVDYGMQQVVYGVCGMVCKVGVILVYLIVGKSGIVQVVVIKQNECYDCFKLFEWYCDYVLFVGFVLVNNLQIVVVVMVENGEFGFGVVVLVVKQVMDVWLFDEYGKFKVEYVEFVVLFVVVVVKFEFMVVELEVFVFEQ